MYLIFTIFQEKKTQTHLSSCINMNVFADLLTFLGQDKFQQFVDETPFEFFYDLHNIKIQYQLLRHIFLLETENDRDDMFFINANDTDKTGQWTGTGSPDRNEPVPDRTGTR